MTTELKVALKEAEKAYHLLMIGQSAVEFRDQNGEMIRYNAMSAARLLGYIADLKRQLGIATNSAPMRAWF